MSFLSTFFPFIKQNKHGCMLTTWWELIWWWIGSHKETCELREREEKGHMPSMWLWFGDKANQGGGLLALHMGRLQGHALLYHDDDSPSFPFLTAHHTYKTVLQYILDLPISFISQVCSK